MEININRPENEPEAIWWGQQLVIDKAGCDIIFEDGTRYSANWGDLFPNEVGEQLILDEFKDSGEDDRKEILDSLKDLVELLEDYDG